MPHEGRDLSVIANCLCCDSYFVYTIDTVPHQTEFRGRSGKELLDELLLQKQASFQEKSLPYTQSLYVRRGMVQTQLRNGPSYLCWHSCHLTTEERFWRANPLTGGACH